MDLVTVADSNRLLLIIKQNQGVCMSILYMLLILFGAIVMMSFVKILNLGQVLTSLIIVFLFLLVIFLLALVQPKKEKINENENENG